MTTTENKKLIERYLKALGTKNWEELGKCLHPDFTFYPQVDTPFKGVQGFLDAEEEAFEAFSAIKVYPAFLIAEDDRVASLTMFEYTHGNGRYFGMRPLGKSGRVSIGMFFRIQDGLIIEKRAHYDKGDLWVQMGADGLMDYIQSL